MIVTYRERRLAGLFRNPGTPLDAHLKVGSSGPACLNLRAALRYLGFELPESGNYDDHVKECVRQLQVREGHENTDGLTGPGTRDLLARVLIREGGRRVSHLLPLQGGELFPLVFISYAREDRRKAEQVVDFLLEQGVRVWVDYRDLQPGEKWEPAIERAIPAARYFLILLSKYTLTKTGFVQKEVKTAWKVAENHPDAHIFVIPARLEECEVRETRFAELNYIDLFPDLPRGLARLVAFLADGE